MTAGLRSSSPLITATFDPLDKVWSTPCRSHPLRNLKYELPATRKPVALLTLISVGEATGFFICTAWNVNRLERRQRITEYDNQIRNLEATNNFVIEKLADAQYVVAFLIDLEDTYAQDIADLKQQRENLMTPEGKIPGLAYTVNKKRVNRPKKRQPKTHNKNGTPVADGTRPPHHRKGVRRRAV